MNRILVLFCSLSVLTAVWLSIELGFLTPSAFTQDTTPVSATVDFDKIKKQISEKESKLQKREQAIETKERELSDRENLVRQQLDGYEKKIQELKTEISGLKKNQEEKNIGMVQVFEKMEPKRSAKILDEMDLETATKLIISMKQQRAAEILSSMQPSRAKAITAKSMAGTSKTQGQ
jgi:flagellar motility protein MotE (MotC chaperone)